MIQPRDYDWPVVFQKLYENQATYCEVYAPSFTLERQTLLADEVRKFADHCRKNAPAAVRDDPLGKHTDGQARTAARSSAPAAERTFDRKPSLVDKCGTKKPFGSAAATQDAERTRVVGDHEAIYIAFVREEATP